MKSFEMKSLMLWLDVKLFTVGFESIKLAELNGEARNDTPDWFTRAKQKNNEQIYY